MRISLSFSFDIDEDAGLLKWLASQPNRSEAARQALYKAMDAIDVRPVETPALLAATRRIEAELNELKALILDNAGGFRQVGPHALPGYIPSLDDPTLTNTLTNAAAEMASATKEMFGVGEVHLPQVPGDVLSNLRKLK